MKNKKLILFITAIVLLNGIVVYLSIPQTHYEKSTPKIGGHIIRKITERFESWNKRSYDITYYYTATTPKDKILLGQGFFYGQKPEGDTEFVQIKDWCLLKSRMGTDTDIILYGKPNIKNWKEFRLSPETIESAPLWQSFNINSVQWYNNKTLSAKAIIEKIENEKVYVYYEFPVDENNTSLFDRRRLTFDIMVGSNYLDLKMVKIEELIE